MALTQQFAAGTTLTAQKLNESSIPVVSSTSDIGSPFAGQIIFNTTDTRLYRYTGSAWVVFSGGPTWALTRAAVQSIPNSAWTTMNWTVENVDTGGVHATNADTVVVTQPGLYAINGKVSYAGNATGQRACRLTLNGALDANTISGSSVIVPNNGASLAAAAATPTIYAQLALNDVIRVQTWQNSGGALNTATSLGDEPLFTGTWLRD